MGKNAFVATERWLHHWKIRENIVFKRTHGEEKDTDFGAAENWLKNK